MRILPFSIMLSFLGGVAPGQTSLQYLDFGPNGKVTAITSDANGNVYVAGNAEDFQSSPGLNTIRIYKLSLLGPTVYSFDLQPGRTSLDGAGTVTALAVDPSGGLFAAGYVGCSNTGMPPSFPTLHPLVISPTSIYCGFLFTLDSTGSKLLFSTLLAGSQESFDPEVPFTFITAIALDSTGAVYLT